MVAFFIDSADRASVETAIATGLFAGVTTNPSILAKAGLGSADIPAVVGWAEQAGAERIFVQAWGRERAELAERGAWLRSLSPRVVVKVPYSLEGVAAARRLSDDGEVLVTAVHSAVQALPVAASGAAYLAPFVARMDAAGRAGLEEAVAAQEALTAVGASTRVLAGSLREPAQVLELVRRGVTHITLGHEVWHAFFGDAVTRAAVDVFETLAAEERVAS